MTTGTNANPAAASAGENAATYVRELVSKRLAGLLRCETKTRRGKDVEALHDMRVASRRLRSALRIFGDCFPQKRLKRARRRIREVTRVLGATREWDVHIERLTAMHATADEDIYQAGLEHMIEVADGRRNDARDRMIRGLDRLRLSKIKRDIEELLSRVRARKASTRSRGAAWRELAPLIDDAFGGLAGLRETDHPEDMHAMRLAVKRLRYAVELFKHTFERGCVELRQLLRGLQDTLGAHHDCVMLESVLWRSLRKLNKKGRCALAAGLTMTLDRVSRHRHELFEDFLRRTEGMSIGSVRHMVRRDIGLTAARAVQPPNKPKRLRLLAHGA